MKGEAAFVRRDRGRTSTHYNLPVDRAAIEWARDTVLALDLSAPTPATVLFLLRAYIADGNEAARAAAESGLTGGLSSSAPADTCARLEWLRTLVEAAAISDDERLREEVVRTLPAAVEALETAVRRSYEPGEGLLNAGCDEHLQMGSALIAAFDLSGRLPYAMLADELVQFARRRWWKDADGAFDAGFAANCTALHVVCGLATLHADAAYRGAAVISPTSSHLDDARRLAAAVRSRAGEHPQHAGDFGRALLEWFALESNLQ
jgi:hypothetical protein